MRKSVTILFIIALVLCYSIPIVSQNTMRIHYKNGTEQDIAISQVDSITFVEKDSDDEEKNVTLIDSWLWAKKEAGYYELLTFNEDQTYTGYDYYFSYGFDTQTYGWYSLYGNMLTLQSNGFGYRRRYNWFVTGMTGNALEVMTNMGAYTYYRLQPETIYVQDGESSDVFDNEDNIVFTDGVIVEAKGNQLIGRVKGTTYILVSIAGQDKIVAYKVNVK